MLEVYPRGLAVHCCSLKLCAAAAMWPCSIAVYGNSMSARCVKVDARSTEVYAKSTEAVLKALEQWEVKYRTG